jgi:hypothetical protein
MKTETQRAAIAEACGWKFFSPSFAVMDARECDEYEEAPDYLSDLNAMHMAEAKLTTKQRRQFHTELAYVVGNIHAETWDLIHATAAQRAEAFLRTLGKWEDDK